MARLREYLESHFLTFPPDAAQWHEYLASVRAIQGNLSNDGSFIATLLAKAFIAARHGASFDAAEKPQGAPGIDVLLTAPDGTKIAAEIKTTVPYNGPDFGAQQAASFKKDFEKLAASNADAKYLLVTNHLAFEALKRPKYTRQMPGVRIVDLVSGKEHVA